MNAKTLLSTGTIRVSVSNGRTVVSATLGSDKAVFTPRPGGWLLHSVSTSRGPKVMNMEVGPVISKMIDKAVAR